MNIYSFYRLKNLSDKSHFKERKGVKLLIKEVKSFIGKYDLFIKEESVIFCDDKGVPGVIVITIGKDNWRTMLKICRGKKIYSRYKVIKQLDNELNKFFQFYPRYLNK